MADVIRAVRPRFVLVENVAALLDDSDAFGWLLGDMATLGFDAEWSVVPACAVGAPHVRERLFLVADADRFDGPARLGAGDRWPLCASDRGEGAWLHPVDGFLEAAGRSRRVVDGLPDELEPARVAALGNAVVPQVAEHVGRLIVAADAGRAALEAS
jgi:DNA (cytosine-5)-methyltransferase 1